MKKLLFLSAIIIGLPVAAVASPPHVTWGTATDMSGDSDVANDGTVLDAATFYTTATTVNGVTFNPMTLLAGSYSDASGDISVNEGTVIGPDLVTYQAYTGGSTNYQNVVSTLLFTSDGVSTGPTITLSGLNIGTTYQVEVWAYDGKASDDGKITTQLTGSTAPNGLINGSTLPTNPEIGQFVIGDFTATSSTLLFQALQTQNFSVISDISVIALPEPSQVYLLGMGLAFLAVILRRRRVAS